MFKQFCCWLFGTSGVGLSFIEVANVTTYELRLWFMCYSTQSILFVSALYGEYKKFLDKNCLLSIDYFSFCLKSSLNSITIWSSRSLNLLLLNSFLFKNSFICFCILFWYSLLLWGVIFNVSSVLLFNFDFWIDFIFYIKTYFYFSLLT